MTPGEGRTGAGASRPGGIAARVRGRERQRLLAFALIVVAAVGLTDLAEAVSGLTQVSDWELQTLDWRQATTIESFQVGRGERESDVVLVLFDEMAVERWYWEQPFPRAHLADLIDALSMAGARTIGLDVWLENRSQGLDLAVEGDARLRAAMERAGNVILVAPVQETDSGTYVFGSIDPYFADVAAGVGTAELGTAFETYRNGALLARRDDGVGPSFALALYAHARGLDVDSILDEAAAAGRLDLPGLPGDLGDIPGSWWEGDEELANPLVQFPIRFVGPPSSSDAADPPGTFQTFGSSTLSTTAMLLPDFFRDKIVLLGTGFHEYDKFRTPFNGMSAPADTAIGRPAGEYGWMFGIEIHANALQNMLDGEYVRPLSAWTELILLLLAALIAGGVAFQRGAAWGGAATVGVGVVVFALAFWLWAGVVFVPGADLIDLPGRFVWMPIITPLLAGGLSYVGSVAYVSIVEGKEKRFIKGAFGKFVSPAVVAEIAENPESLQLGGSKKVLTLLFSDLAGFTTLSEELDPQDLLQRLNEYLSDMTDIVLAEQGTVDKYIGDAIMAFWNAPKPVADHADRALRCAVLMQRRMAELNALWRERDPEHTDMVVRIGINTGTVVVGNLGGENTFNYSAIGDPVNLAARLEPANKTYGTLTMVSEFTLNAADASAYRLRELDFIAVTGKIEPVRVYEVLEMAGVGLPPHREEALRHFESGFQSYKGRDWELAARYFEAALDADPKDGPSKVYLGRARQYVADPPPADWDFVVRRTSK